MRKIKRWKQGIAVAGVIALTGSLFAGCGGADGKNSGSKGKTGSSNQAENADTADLVNVNTDNSDGKKTKDESTKAMGRFLENDLTVPENSQFLRDVKVLDSGTLRMVYYSTADNCYYAADSADNGETWTNGKSLEELLGLKENLGEYISVVSAAADGSIFVGVDLSPDRDNENAQTTADSGEEDSAYDNLKMEFFYLSPDGNVQKVDTGDTIQSSYTFQACFTENGTVLIVDPGNGVAEINPSDGSLVRRYEERIRVDFIGTAGKMLFTIQDQTLHGYDLDTGKPLDNISALTEQIQSDERIRVDFIGTAGKMLFTIQDQTLHGYDLDTGKPLDNISALTEQIQSDEQDVNWTTTSSFPLMFLKGDEDNSLFYIDHTGVYRYVLGGSTVEQIIDASLNSLSSPDTGTVAWGQDSDGNFYVGCNAGEDIRIYSYVYSKDTPTTPDTELTVYSLKDSNFIKQAAVLFQKKYPDIYVNIEAGMSGDDSVTDTDALKVLNTEIMAGTGPDVLLLDGISEDTYIERGMLENLSGVLKDEDILPNIKDAYTKEDGSIYTMPVKFGIPMIEGNKDIIAGITDLTTEADAAESQKDSYGKLKFFSSFSISPSWLIQGTIDNSTSAWMNEDGTLKEDALKEYLEQVNRIWQTQKDAIEETKKAYQMGDDWANSDRSGYTNIAGSITDLLVKVNTVAAGGLLSPEGLVYLDSAKKVDPDLDYRLLNGQSENCFYPRSIVGISAKASEKEAAEKFVKFLFEEESQRASNDEGLAVNSKVYEDMAYWKMGKSSGDTIGSIGASYDTGDGNIQQLEMDEIIPEDEAIQNIMDLGKTLNVPAKSNQIIRNAVTESGEKYLNGETGLDDAVKEIMQEVNLYLSE